MSITLTVTPLASPWHWVGSFIWSFLVGWPPWSRIREGAEVNLRTQITIRWQKNYKMLIVGSFQTNQSYFAELIIKNGDNVIIKLKRMTKYKIWLRKEIFYKLCLAKTYKIEALVDQKGCSMALHNSFRSRPKSVWCKGTVLNESTRAFFMDPMSPFQNSSLHNVPHQQGWLQTRQVEFLQVKILSVRVCSKFIVCHYDNYGQYKIQKYKATFG